jgi:hypothetical protein
MSPTTLPDPAQIVEKVREIVATRPDFVYSFTDAEGKAKCYYFVDGQPSCIVGHALAAFGVPATIFERDGGEYYVNGLSIDRPQVLKILGWPMSRLVEWLRTVQVGQDSGYTWRKSVDNADEYFPL